jgi:pyruvate,water dikinase
LYGDRGLEELKLEMPTFREDPAQLIRLVRSYTRQNLSVDLMEEKERAMRREAEEAARGALKNPFRRLVFWFVLRNTRLSIANRENMRFARTRLFGIVRRVFRRLGDLLQEQGVLARASDINYLTVEEVFGLIQGTAVTQDVRPLVSVRAAEYRRHAEKEPRERFETTGIPCLAAELETAEKTGQERRLRGIPCSSGPAHGPAKVVLDPGRVNGDTGHILVARSTDPGWIFLMVSAKGVVTERGSILSHTAIIGRELGIPTIVGVRGATRLIPDGALLHMDGGTGEVRWQ